MIIIQSLTLGEILDIAVINL